MRLALIATAAGALAAVNGAEGGGAPLRDRRAFAAALADVRPGMPEQRVLEALGPADDVRTETDRGGFFTTHTNKVLRYGTNGHLSCATLGQVYLDRAGVVQYVFGGRGAPPPPDLVPEGELRRLLSLLNEVSSYNSSDGFNPLPLIRAVNALHAAGREKALAVIGEYLRVSSDFDDPAREGMFLVLRTLFDAAPGAGGMPRMFVGAPSPPEPSDPRAAPRFPVLIAGDIPWLGVIGYTLVGLAERPETHLAWFRAHGTLRSRPLRPPDDPLETFDRLLAEHRSDPSLPTALVNQLLALLDSVHRVESGPDGLLFVPGPTFGESWSPLREQLARLKIRWDSGSVRYVFADGSVLPDEPQGSYRRVLWSFKLAQVEGRLALERRDRRFVHVEVRAPARQLTVSVRSVSGATLSRLSWSASVSTIESTVQSEIESIDSRTVDLPEGEAIRVEIDAAGTHVTSPELRP
jgi:hypothetical protein